MGPKKRTNHKKVKQKSCNDEVVYVFYFICCISRCSLPMFSFSCSKKIKCNAVFNSLQVSCDIGKRGVNVAYGVEEAFDGVICASSRSLSEKEQPMVVVNVCNSIPIRTYGRRKKVCFCTRKSNLTGY